MRALAKKIWQTYIVFSEPSDFKQKEKNTLSPPT